MKLLVNSDAKYIPLKDGSVHCVVTSPPYFGLRDYGTAEWVGGDTECDHKVGRFEYPVGKIQSRNSGSAGHQAKKICPKCGAVQVDNQIGLEETIEDYIQKMVMVGREIWRVLRDDGTFWLNLGDSYAGSGDATGHTSETTNCGREPSSYGAVAKGGKAYGLKPKDKMFIPERTAMALQADGWWVRRDIIWAKGCSFNYKGGSTMPESCKDRPTSSHEYVYIFTKSERYFYDYYGVLEDALYDGRKDTEFKGSVKDYEGVLPNSKPQAFAGAGHERWPNTQNGVQKRNLRSVWVINTASYPGSHYAVYPEDLITPIILASTSAKGVCPECGAPWERVVEKGNQQRHESEPQTIGAGRGDNGDRTKHAPPADVVNEYWQPTCACGHDETVPATVLDPFVGSGTTCMVARKHRRKAIGLDLSFEYLNVNARERLQYGGFVHDGAGNKQLTLEV